MKARPNGPLMWMVLFWGFNFVAVKVLYKEMSPPAVSIYRWLVMYGLLIGICRVRRLSLVPKREDWPLILLVGAICMGAYMVLFLEGMSKTTSSEGAIMLATSPILTYLFSCLRKHEPFSGGALIGAIIAFIGVGTVILGGSAAGHGSLMGNLTVLLSAVVWAVGAVVMKPLVSKYDPTQLLTISMPGALPILIPYGLMATVNTDLSRISPTAWFMFGTVAVLSGVVAFACFYAGIRKIGAPAATLYQYFVPPTAVFFGWVVLKVVPTPMQLSGLLIVLGGVAYAGRARQVAREMATASV